MVRAPNVKTTGLLIGNSACVQVSGNNNISIMTAHLLSDDSHHVLGFTFQSVRITCLMSSFKTFLCVCVCGVMWYVCACVWCYVVCMWCAPGVPQVCPRCAPGVDQVCPRCAPGVDQVWTRCAPGVPQVCPRCAPGVPQVWTRCNNNNKKLCF